MPDLLTDADVGISNVLSDVDVGIASSRGGYDYLAPLPPITAERLGEEHVSHPALPIPTTRRVPPPAPVGEYDYLQPLPPITEAQLAEDKTPWSQRPAVTILAPRNAEGIGGIPRIPTLGEPDSKLRAASEFAQTAQETLAGGVEGMTTPEAVRTYPLFAIPYVGPVLSAVLGTKIASGGLAEVITGAELHDPSIAGSGFGKVLLSAPLLRAGASLPRSKAALTEEARVAAAKDITPREPLQIPERFVESPLPEIKLSPPGGPENAIQIKGSEKPVPSVPLQPAVSEVEVPAESRPEGVREGVPATPQPEISLTDPVGNTPEFYSLPRLRALDRSKDPRLAAAKKYYGAKTVPDLARLAKARFDEMATKAKAKPMETREDAEMKRVQALPEGPEGEAQLVAEDIAKAVETVDVSDIAGVSPVSALVRVIRRAARDPAMKTAAEQAMQKIGAAAREQGVPLDAIKQEVAGELKAIYGADAAEMAKAYFGEENAQLQTEPSGVQEASKVPSTTGFKRESPPQVAQPIARLPAEVIIYRKGGQSETVKGTEYLMPGFEEYHTVLLKPSGSKAKATKLGWRVVEKTTGFEISESGLSSQEAITLALQRLRAFGKSAFDKRIDDYRDAIIRDSEAAIARRTETPAPAAAKAQAEVPLRMTFEQFQTAPREGRLLDELRKVPKREKTPEQVAAAERDAKATEAVNNAKLSWIFDRADPAKARMVDAGLRRLPKAKKKIVDEYEAALTAKIKSDMKAQEGRQRELYDALVAKGVIEAPIPPGPGAASPSPFFPRRSEALGMGEPSMPPTVEDVRRQRLLDREGTPVPPSTGEPTPPPSGPAEVATELTGEPEIVNAIRQQDVMPGRDWLASPEFEFRKNPVANDLVTKVVEGELEYRGQVGRDIERFDTIKRGLTTQQQVRVTEALRAVQSGDATALSRLTDQERTAAAEIRQYFDDVKEKIIASKREDLIDAMPDARGRAVRDILGGMSEADAFRTHRLRTPGRAAVRAALAELEALEKWGPQDYVTNIERGSYRIVNEEGTTVAVAETSVAAKEKALRYAKEHPGTRKLTITDEFETNVEFPTKLSRGQYFRMAKRAADALGTDVREIQRMLRAEGSPIVVIKPASKFSGPMQRRYDVLKGEDNLFDALPNYAYSIRKKLTLDPIFKEARTQIPKLPEHMRGQVEELLNDARGRYSLEDKISDYLLSPLGQKPFMFSRGVSVARQVMTNLKLGYRPITALINRLGGLQHTWTKTGTKYWVQGRQFLRTPEFREIWERNADYVGATAQSFLEGTHPSESRAWQPLAMFQYAERVNRPEAFAAFYKYAQGELGLTGEAAEAFARKSTRFGQFVYTTSSLPRLLRTPSGRLVGQFKSYLVKEMEFISSLRGFEIPRYLTGFLVMGGPRAAIYMLRSIPVLGAIGALWALEDWLNRKAPAASRGAPGMAGVDITPAVTPQLPSRATDWMGPTLSDVWHLWNDVVRPAMQGERRDFSDVKDWGTRLMPALMYWGRLIESASNKDGWITDELGRMQYKPTAGGKVALALGAKPLEQSVQDVDHAYMDHVNDIAKKNRTRLIDDIVDALDKGDGVTLDKLLKDAADYGIDTKAIREAAKQKAREPDERLRRRLLKSVRVEQAEREAEK